MVDTPFRPEKSGKTRTRCIFYPFRPEKRWKIRTKLWVKWVEKVFLVAFLIPHSQGFAQSLCSFAHPSPLRGALQNTIKNRVKLAWRDFHCVCGERGFVRKRHWVACIGDFPNWGHNWLIVGLDIMTTRVVIGYFCPSVFRILTPWKHKVRIPKPPLISVFKGALRSFLSNNLSFGYNFLPSVICCQRTLASSANEASLFGTCKSFRIYL